MVAAGHLYGEVFIHISRKPTVAGASPEAYDRLTHPSD